MTKHRTLDREKVLQAAQDIVKDHNFEALTFQSLAKTLDVRSQSLYNYFDNLDCVVEALGEQFMNALYDQLTEALTGISGREALQTYAQIAHDYFDQQGQLFQLIYYVHQYPEDSGFVTATGKVLNLLRRLIAHVRLKHMTQEAYVQALISAVLGYTVLEIMGFLQSTPPVTKTNFHQLLNLYMAEVQSPKGEVTE